MIWLEKQHSFELVNNKLRLFPRPEDDDAGEKIYFHYYKRNDRIDVTQDYTLNKVSDPSNIPYKFINLYRNKFNG